MLEAITADHDQHLAEEITTSATEETPPLNVTRPAPAQLATVTLTTNSGDITIPCEPISDWLAITPVFAMDAETYATFYDGTFAITHRPTGTLFSEGTGCIGCCRAAGRRMTALDVDWSALTGDNGRGWWAALPESIQLDLSTIRAVEWACGAEYCDHSASGGGLVQHPAEQVTG